MSTAEAPAAEQLEFKTEVRQLLNLVVHSLYTKSEIFLRELISNAADAIDKMRFESLTQPALADGNTDWKIKLIPDESAGTLTIRDNGIGMDRGQAIDHLGTIAKSGTATFLKNLAAADAKDRPELIGQFGVGFYSSYMVANKVTVLSRLAGMPADAGVKWQSDGQGQYTVENIEKADRGTDVVLHLKEDAKEFLKEWKLRELVKRYSDFIEHPIALDVTTEKDGQKVATEQIINSRTAIWLRSKQDVKPEEYAAFYKAASHGFEDPLTTVHFAAEGGATEFRALLFLPGKRPFDFMWREQKPGVDLYVRRVLIEKESEQLLPRWLRFVRGVVDSADLPLNVSRETLQHNPLLAKIRTNLINRLLKTLDELKSSEYEKYVGFFDEFGSVIKEGVTDWSNKERVADLLLFESTKTQAGKYTTFEKYVAAMPDVQKDIYYLTGDSREVVEHSPLLEQYKADGREVLLLVDPVDEFLVDALREYKGKKLVALDRAEAEEKTDALKAEQEKFQPLLTMMKNSLPGEVKDVRLTSRLRDSAAVLVADGGEMPAHMEQLMKRMGRAEGTSAKRTLELNPQHPVVASLLKLFGDHASDPRIERTSRLLYDQAVVAEGSKVVDATAFAKRINDLLANDLK